MSDNKLLPCPFCGHDTPEFERLGTPRHSCIVSCGNCGCRHESSDEGDRCGESWNTRAAPPAPAVAELPALPEPWDTIDGEWCGQNTTHEVFRAYQMHAYARAAIAADRAARAVLTDERVKELEAAMLYVKNNAGRGDLVWEKARAVLAATQGSKT